MLLFINNIKNLLQSKENEYLLYLFQSNRRWVEERNKQFQVAGIQLLTCTNPRRLKLHPTFPLAYKLTNLTASLLTTKSNSWIFKDTVFSINCRRENPYILNITTYISIWLHIKEWKMSRKWIEFQDEKAYRLQSKHSGSPIWVPWQHRQHLKLKNHLPFLRSLWPISKHKTKEETRKRSNYFLAFSRQPSKILKHK